MPDSFQEKLALAREAEMSVSEWLKSRGYAVIPSYDYCGENGDKAPRMSTAKYGYPVPDLDVAKDGNRIWVEVKRYTRSVLNRRHNCYVHGIPRRLYNSYVSVEMITGCTVYLAIEEEQHNRLLVAPLLKLRVIPCLCGCTDSGVCRAPGKNAIKNGVYFDVDQFKIYESTLTPLINVE